MENLITKGAGQHLPVVFDFDNTLVCGDIGEATFAVLARTGVLTPQTVPQHLCPTFRTAGNRQVSIGTCADATEYYEALLEPTVHGPKDSRPLANGYAWVTQVMENLTVDQVVNATREAFEWGDSANPGWIEVTPGRTAYPVPFFYPEMLELLAELLRHKFEAWIVSASNVWSVRWMVLNALNPLMRERGSSTGLRTDHVIGISTLLADRRGKLYKDGVLVRENERYASLESTVVARFRLASQLQYPVPTYSGKIAAIFDNLGRNPFLVAGDSPGDLPMMAISPHRLWVARLDKPGYQRTALTWFRQSEPHSWIVQPTMANRSRGFISQLTHLSGTDSSQTRQARHSLKLLREITRSAA